MEAGYSITATKRKARVEVDEEEEEEEEGSSWASHTLRIRKHMQWSSEGLGGERELEEGKECFFGEERRGEGEGWKHKCSASQAYFHPAFILHPLRYSPPPPPTHSPSSLNLWDDEIGVQGLGGRRGRRPLAGAIL